MTGKDKRRAETRAERGRAVAKMRRLMRDTWREDEARLHDGRDRIERFCGKLVLRRGPPTAREVKANRKHRELMAKRWADNRRKCSCPICRNQKTRTDGLKVSERRRAGAERA